MNRRGILTAFGAIQGTAHVLYTPAITPPADHFSQEAIGYSLDWFARTLTGGTPLQSTGQIWPRKELGTSIALIGFVMLLLGAFDLLLGWSTFASLRIFPPGQDAAAGLPQQSGPWWNGKLIDPVPASPVVPLSTIIAIQFIPLLVAIAVISTFTWRRTGTALPGALICGLLVTCYIGAGMATQAPI